MSKPTIVGHIVIWVEGYRNAIATAYRLNVPDDSITGWAVGTGNHYCSREFVDKLQRFKEYDDAIAWIDRRRRRAPHERFQLVYLRENPGRVNQMDAVSSLDEILEIDRRAAVEEAVREEQRKAVRRELFPFHEELSRCFGGAKAMRLAAFILEVRAQGADAVRDKSRATYYRYKKDLEIAGITIDAAEAVNSGLAGSA